MEPRAEQRPSRCGTPRSSGPDRRSGREHWQLWHLRTLRPEADLADLDDLKARFRQTLAREREALARLWSGDRAALAPGHGFLARHPELTAGVIASLHLGPYQFLPEPLVRAGAEPAVVLNRAAMAQIVPRTRELLARLGHGGRLEWVAVDDHGFASRLLRILRDGRPVIVYLDGNGGTGGLASTRRRGLLFRLPGRDVRVRTGLARLVCRLGCPVHPVVLHWDERGTPVWRKEPTRVWTAADDPDDVTRRLFDWCFHEVACRPEQWHFWEMLKESAVCFAGTGLDQPTVPRGLREDFHRAYLACLEKAPDTVRLILEKSVEVWPGDVLADLTEDRFYAAAGLRDEDLQPLRRGRPTLSTLSDLHGRAWVRFHGLRLCLLGMARLGG